MIPLKPQISIFKTNQNPLRISLFPPQILPHNPPLSPKSPSFSPSHSLSSLSLIAPTSRFLRVSEFTTQIPSGEDEIDVHDLSPKGPIYQKTLQLVECSMFAALTGLVYFLSNSLAIEVCFFNFLFYFLVDFKVWLAMPRK